MSEPFRCLATLALLALCPWLPAVEDVELFIIDDGRELVGTYDDAAGKLSVLTPNGYIVVDVAKERIVRRKPTVIPEYAAPSAPATDGRQTAASSGGLAPISAPAPKPVAKAPAPPAGTVGGNPLDAQLMEFARQKMMQLQKAAAAGDPAAMQQLKQLEGLIEQHKRKGGR